MKQIVLTVLVCLVCSPLVRSQELLAKVRVNAPNLVISDKNIFVQMENNIREFLNSQKWTDDKFENNEKIKCSFQFNISGDLGNNLYTADIQVQSTRPVFNSTYETTLLKISDNAVQFTFDPYKPIENSKSTYYDNLSSVLTYYALLIVAMDYESFGIEGGDSYLNSLKNMINTMPSNGIAADKKWQNKIDLSYNRYKLIETLKDPRMKLFRRVYYEYHRLCLDGMEKDKDNARRIMTNAIEDLVKLNTEFPNTWALQIFVNAKSNELVEIYKQAPLQEKQRIYQALLLLDPSNNSAYNVLKS
ncbi:MAG TPA: DUF4835 family protein [Saprospiraceae bacterium]|nr:DUF4835 family protein [Saprospiraceae bacterium]